ncbi:helix-turn-helix domain-containing protein [Candidatus Harpocratesius sp.]
MTNYLESELDVKLLKNMCSGSGVEINISFFAEKFGKHRNTIKSKIDNLLTNNIIKKPLYPFNALLNQLSLLVIEKVDLPRDPKTNKWIEEDPYIWAAYFVKEEEYNTLLIELHRDFYSYQLWKEKIFLDELIMVGEGQIHYSEPIFSSTKSILKNKPEDSIRIIKRNFKNKANPFLGDLKFDELSIEILKMLLNGKGIRTNENHLSKILGIHRKTIQRRISKYLQENIVGTPRCVFPRIWSPPSYFTVLSLLQVKHCNQRNRVLQSLIRDPHIAFITKINTRNYDYAMLSNFYKIADHLEWFEVYNTRFQNCIGAIKNTYLSPSMAFSIDYNYVTDVFLEAQLKRLRGKEFMESMNLF